MDYPLYQIDAFADAVFSGNPAAVIPVPRFLPDALMQSIAAENNLSETAFVVTTPDAEGAYPLRWFTPTVEIEFCGHATIAAAHCLHQELGLAPPFAFETQIGRLSVAIDAGRLTLSAPLATRRPTPITQAMRRAFPMPLSEAFWASRNLFIVCQNAEDISGLTPDMTKILPLSDHGVGITARAQDDVDYDCVSRFFVPAEGIDEDPVTGSAHAAIGPYWAERLQRKALRAYQASRRGGYIDIEVGETTVQLTGKAVTYLCGTITL